MAGGIRGQGNEVDIRLSFYFYFCLSVRYGGQIDANEWFVGCHGHGNLGRVLGSHNALCFIDKNIGVQRSTMGEENW